MSLNEEDLKKIGEWLIQEGAGRSSMTMVASALGYSAPRKLSSEIYYPQDRWDFGRCVDLIEAVPSIFEAAMPLLSKTSWEWSQLIDNWLELVDAYEQDRDNNDEGSVFPSTLKEVLTKSLATSVAIRCQKVHHDRLHWSLATSVVIRGPRG